MKTYIERAAVEKFIEDGLNNPDKNRAFGHDAIEIMAEVHYMPAADVVEVRHGRWAPEIHHTYLPVEYDDAGGPILHEYISYRCSLCGREEAKEELYCHCGARMDKEDEHEAD